MNQKKQQEQNKRPNGQEDNLTLSNKNKKGFVTRKEVTRIWESEIGILVTEKSMPMWIRTILANVNVDIGDKIEIQDGIGDTLTYVFKGFKRIETDVIPINPSIRITLKREGKEEPKITVVDVQSNGSFIAFNFEAGVFEVTALSKPNEDRKAFETRLRRRGYTIREMLPSVNE